MHPHITLLIAPAAAGKTEAALAVLREPRLGRALVLTPSSLHQRRFKERIGGLPRVGIRQFSGLVRMVLLRARIKVEQMSATMRALLLRRILREMVAEGQLPTFRDVAHKPGFIATVGDLIAEAQQAEVEPEALLAAGVTPYDAELGAIYAAFNAALARLGYADIARRLALARDALRDNPRLLNGIGLLVVDGFDQFTPFQLSLLAEATRQIPRTIITLTGSPDARPAHRRFARTRDEMDKRLEIGDWRLLQSAVAPGSPHFSLESLAHLESHLFSLDTPRPIPADGALELIEAADREREVRAALRRAHALLSAGTAAEEIAVLFRDGAIYGPLLREIAAEYNLPLALYEGLPLAEAPPIVALLTMLRLPIEDYPRRALVETWRNMRDWGLAVGDALETVSVSSELQPPIHNSANLLDQAARAAGVTVGFARLRAALAALAEAEPSVDDDEPAAVLPPAAAELLGLLDAFAAWLTPPERATVAEYVAWTRARTENREPRASVLDSWFLALEGLAQAATALDEPLTTYRAFIADLEATIGAARYGEAAPEPGKVAALTVLAARGSCFDHVILLGLAEGEFPLRLPDPPIYSRRERRILAQRGVALPPPDPADERSLFYEAVTRARRSLTLARTRLDGSGNELPPSPYLSALLDLFTPDSILRQQIKAGSVPTLEEAISPQEQLVALMEMGDATLQAPAQISQLYHHVRHACAIERHREETGAYGSYEGIVDDPQVIALLAEQFGPTHHWSVTQFNDYITCPFRFAAAHVLGLARRDEPEEGLDHGTRGRLYHKILAEAGKQWRQLRLLHHADNEAALLATLHAAADQVLSAAPALYGIQPGAFWGWEQAEVRRRLVRALQRVLSEGGDWASFRSAGVEESFGPGKRYCALRLDTPAGEVLVAGRVDRIDQRDDDKALALIDYKSGSTPRSLDETLNGRDVQLAVYLLAVEQVIARSGQHVERAAFLHLGSGKRSKPLTDQERDQALAAMRERVAETVRGAQAGHFAVRPRDECPTGCAYSAICRLNLRKRDANAG